MLHFLQVEPHNYLLKTSRQNPGKWFHHLLRSWMRMIFIIEATSLTSPFVHDFTLLNNTTMLLQSIYPD